MVKLVKLPLAMLESYGRMPVGVPAVPLLTQFLASMSGKTTRDGPNAGPLPPIQQIQMEFELPA